MPFLLFPRKRTGVMVLKELFQNNLINLLPR
jgi:hypothetical protein